MNERIDAFNKACRKLEEQDYKKVELLVSAEKVSLWLGVASIPILLVPNFLFISCHGLFITIDLITVIIVTLLLLVLIVVHELIHGLCFVETKSSAI